ncbi:MAG: chemotaxis protein CheW [Thiomargarita sp.]|nr:chemotaxis protein CheW [Thiomargarita sp.]
MSEVQATIRCVLIPTQVGSLLLPSTIIAEIFPINEVTPLFKEQPKWLLGMIDWREQRVPLLSIEEALLLPLLPATGLKQHTIVLYGLESTQKMPFYAFKSVQVPHSLTIKEDDLTQFRAENRKGLVFTTEYKEYKSILLPDTTYLENLLLQSQLFS